MTPIDYNDPNSYWLHQGYDPYKGMSDDERMRTGCLQGIAYIFMILAAFVLCAIFGSCTTTKVVTVERHTTDTLRLSRNIRDSIYLSDSIYINDFVREDTVYKTVERWHTQYRDRWHTDTIYKSRTDTVPMPYPVVKTVPAELTWWQQSRIHLANIVLWMLLIAAALWTYHHVRLRH